MIVARSWHQKQSSTLARAYSDSTLIPLSVNNLLAVLASVNDTSSSLDPLPLGFTVSWSAVLAEPQMENCESQALN